MTTPASTPLSRTVTLIMGGVTASLAVASALHLSGAAGGGKGADPTAAGVAEAVICVVLAWGTVLWHRRGPAARALALGANGFAVAGFALGLSFTARGDYLPDLLYHAIVLPIILLTVVLLLLVKRSSDGVGRERGSGTSQRVRSR